MTSHLPVLPDPPLCLASAPVEPFTAETVGDALQVRLSLTAEVLVATAQDAKERAERHTHFLLLHDRKLLAGLLEQRIRECENSEEAELRLRAAARELLDDAATEARSLDIDTRRERGA